MMRKDPIASGHTYHVMSKSIEGYTIFPRPEDYQRFIKLLKYFRLKNPPTKFSFFLERNPDVIDKGFDVALQNLEQDCGLIVDVVAFCLMPTHFHIIVRQREDNGISQLMRHMLNGYARYFNTKYKRKGTLWMSRFKNVAVTTDEQLLHLSRYVHLNPVTAGIVRRAEEWEFSSYKEFIAPDTAENRMTTPVYDLLDISPKDYKTFVEDRAGFQRELAIIKKQALE